MKLYPAIDLIDGAAVRLTKGKFTTARQYSDDPFVLAKSFEENGARSLHIIDLDGARTGHPLNTKIIAKIVSDTRLKVQVGGGIRNMESARILLDCGIERVIIGSAAITQKESTIDMIREFGEKSVTIALDCQRCDSDEPIVAIHGWQKESKRTLWEVLDDYRELQGLRILSTDIKRDGMITGSNIDLYSRILARYPNLILQASGGVASLSEISKLATMKLESCIIGKALYEKTFTLDEALACKGVTC